MITPYTTVQRGNSLTTARLQRFLTARGFHVDRFSIESADWPQRLQRALAHTQYNLIHGFHALHFGRVLTEVPIVQELPILLTATGTDIHYDLQGPQKELVQKSMRAAQKIVVFNDDFCSNIQSRYPEYKDKLVTIPQGVFLEPGAAKTRSKIGLGPKDFVFLLPSGLRPVKNIGLAIEAIREVHHDHPEVRLLIMGAVIDEDYARPLLTCMQELDWIIYLGEVPHIEMGSLLALGDVVLNTSDSEGQPQAALEAMSLGKPCILTAVPGNLDLIANGCEGFYVQDQNDLVAAANILLTNPIIRHNMGQNASRLVQAKFSLEQEVNAYSCLYQMAIGQAED